jgi:Zn-dependent protease with chaperone function
LIISLNASELRTIIAHELGHIKNGDMTIITPLVALLTLYDKIAQSYIRSRINNERSPIHQLLLAAFAYIFFRLTYPQTGLLSKIRENHADDFSIQHSKDPSNLINSLIKVSRGCALRPMDKLRVEGSPLRSLMFIDPTAAINEIGDLSDLIYKRWEIDINRLPVFLESQPSKNQEKTGFHAFENFQSHPNLKVRLERIADMGSRFKMPMTVGLTSIE